MRRTFEDKDAAREWVWTELREQKVARFPFPVKGRIPNFKGAKEAARRLLDHDLFADARAIKCNPDSPQRPLRKMALERGITVYVPTPRLKAGFMRFDPDKIDPDDYGEAAALSKWDPHREDVALEDLPQMDVIVAGSVAVTRDGKRCGKGHGFSDIEFGILGELGHDPAPVVTSVHALQVVDDFPTDAHDVPLSLIATPDETIEVDDVPDPPRGLDWDRLTDEDLDEMPVLRQLDRR
ncbi:MAG: 5-formyltetrahydrofolate cyclo-ligase [Persicimonas sp.]